MTSTGAVLRFALAGYTPDIALIVSPLVSTARGKICDSFDRNMSDWRGPEMFHQRLGTSVA
jgi:hypothetical protein